MHATFDQLSQLDRAAPVRRVPRPQAATSIEPAADALADPPQDEWQPCGGYSGRRVRPGGVAAIVLFHAAALGALIQFDVIPIHNKRAHPPLVVTLLPEQVTPPPAPPPPPSQEVQPIRKVEQVVVAPPPVVAIATPAPATIATVPVPVPVPPQATVAAPAPASPGVAPAPITPPDGSAASLRNPAPRYPTESRRKHEEGTVRLRVVITAEGQVKEIGVARTSGFDRLDKAALDAVRKWKFRPGMQAGVAVEAVGFLNIPFQLAH